MLFPLSNNILSERCLAYSGQQFKTGLRAKQREAPVNEA